jgi:hypothetical protein
MDQMEYDSGYRQQRFHQDYSHRPTTIDRASSDLLSEVGGIFTSIARSAGTAVRNKGSIITKNKQLNEFSFMLAIFLCKAGLYFLLQNSYNKGYDFSNL